MSDLPEHLVGPAPVDWRHTRTTRLLLDDATEADVDDLHAIHADPDTWRHFPSGRHTDRGSSVAMVRTGHEQWDRDGLGYWSVREADSGPAGPVVGRGGCSLPAGSSCWNLYYRLSPAVQGRGYAVEMGRRALEAAHDVDPARPVRAFLVEHNRASRRTAERLGMRLVRRGPDQGNPDPAAVRLVYLDRDPTSAVLDALELEFSVAARAATPPTRGIDGPSARRSRLWPVGLVILEGQD